MRNRNLTNLALAALLSSAGCTSEPDERDLLLATTTSTQDSGLLDVLVPAFEQASGQRVKTVAVGTGKALAMARRGDADVVLTHAPTLERQTVADGYTINRRLVMHNDFVIAGPADDPATLSGLSDAVAALARVASLGATFASRADESGTHVRERELWSRAGVAPRGDWYIETGQGMGATIIIAAEKRAYVITDRATHLAMRDVSGLVVHVDGDPPLRNYYSVMEVSGTRFPRVHARAARAFSDYLLSDEAQKIIETFGRSRYGEQLFFPDAGKTEPRLAG